MPRARLGAVEFRLSRKRALLKADGRSLEASIIHVMLDENDFRKRADAALEALKQSLITAEESADFEVEDQSGALHVSFEDGSRFVISPNAPVRQIWISALATSFKLDWSDGNEDFVLQKTGEQLKPLVSRLINQQLGEEVVTLA